MAEKILYYFGAGASAQALPLAKTVWGDLQPLGGGPQIKGLAYELARLSENKVIDDLLKSEENQVIEPILSNCQQLAKKADEFGDVDTYAKYLQIKNPGGAELRSLKETLSQYFAIKQVLLEARDNRYIPWLVAIMERKRFPENVKILSWNYDFQLELASELLDLYGEDIRYSGNGYTYSPSGLSYYPNLDPTFNEFDTLSLIHMNGIAGFGVEGERRISSVFQNDYRSRHNNFFSLLMNNNIQSHIHFAWERSGYHERLMQHAIQMIQGTTIVVVIGYSFPFYNREVDKQIFSSLAKDGLLKKIYFQDPILDGKQLINQFDLKRDMPIEHIKQIDGFHVPFEY